MRLTGTDDTDIMLDINGQPVVDASGAPCIVSGTDCWMQDIWCEMLTEEGELLHEDEEGRMAYGFGLLEYMYATEDQYGEIQARLTEKLTKRDYIDEGSISIAVSGTASGITVSVAFKEVDSSDEMNIDIRTEGTEVYVE